MFNKDKYKYHDVGLNPAIQNAYTRWPSTSGASRSRPTSGHGRRAGAAQLEQAWFPGVHSNVGGGYAPDGLANEALHWVVEKAERLGLEFDAEYLAHFLPCFNSMLVDSMTVAYRIMGPHERELGEHTADGEAVHQSAIDRMNLPACAYGPDNLKAYLAKPGGPQPANTARIARGEPCPDLPR